MATLVREAAAPLHEQEAEAQALRDQLARQAAHIVEVLHVPQHTTCSKYILEVSHDMGLLWKTWPAILYLSLARGGAVLIECVWLQVEKAAERRQRALEQQIENMTVRANGGGDNAGGAAAAATADAEAAREQIEQVRSKYQQQIQKLQAQLQAERSARATGEAGVSYNTLPVPGGLRVCLCVVVVVVVVVLVLVVVLLLVLVDPPSQHGTGRVCSDLTYISPLLFRITRTCTVAHV
jgi:hypothetical protein